MGNNVTVANQPVSLVAIMPASGQTIEILRMWVSQAANATSAQQRIAWGFKATAYQTVTSVAPQALKSSDPASLIVGATTIAAGKSGINASAEGGGALTIVGADDFNVLNGWLWVPTPRETIMINSASSFAFTFQFPAAPSTLTNWSFGVTFAELG
jgi:hypothetical protein